MNHLGKTKRIAILSTDMTTADMGKMTVRLSRDADREKQGGFFAVSGYDDDSRELWDIPEVLSLIDRLDSFGFMSALDCNIDIENFNKPRLFNAFDFWLLRTRQMKKVLRITKATTDAFFASVAESNGRADDTIARELEWADGNCFIQEVAR